MGKNGSIMNTADTLVLMMVLFFTRLGKSELCTEDYIKARIRMAALALVSSQNFVENLRPTLKAAKKLSAIILPKVTLYQVI